MTTKKITELDEESVPLDATDLAVVVSDVSTTPMTKKTTLGTLRRFMLGIAIVGTIVLPEAVVVGGALTVNANVALGASTANTVVFNARVASHMDPSAPATYDIGAPALTFRHAYFSGTVTATSFAGNASTVTNGVYTSGSYANPEWITALAWSKLTGVPSTFAPAAHTHPWSAITSTPTTIGGFGITDFVSLGDAQWVQLDAVSLPATILASSLTSVGTLLNLTVTNPITGSVSGNATTVTNGVYTTGSYADPAWLTALAASKLTGTVDMARLLTAGGGSFSVMASYARPGAPGNLNSYVESGTYGLSGVPTNAPSGSSFDTVLVQRNASDVVTQLYVPRNAGYFLAWRGSTSAIWTAWQTVVDVETAQTISGAKSFSTFIALSNVSSDKKLQFQRTGGNQHSIELHTSGIGLYNETAGAYRWFVPNGGGLIVGGTSGADGAILEAVGKIRAGTANSTDGSVVLQGQYSDGALAVWGTGFSSGGPVMGYAVKPSTTTGNAFLSATAITIPRGAYSVDGAIHRWFSGAVQTVAIDGAVTMTEQMTLDPGGNLYVLSSLFAGGTGYYSYNIAGAVYKRVIDSASVYTQIFRHDGAVGIYLGSSTDPNNYYDNTNHYFRSVAGVLHTTINAAGVTAYDWILSSDVRLKRDITEVQGALGIVRAVPGIRYWHIEKERWELGFGAQHLMTTAIGGLTTTQDESGKYGVLYSRTIPVLWQAVREQDSEVAKLRRQVAELQGAVRALGGPVEVVS